MPVTDNPGRTLATMRNPLNTILVALAGTLAVPRAARGQGPHAVPPAPSTAYERGCRGDATEGTLSLVDGSKTSYPVVVEVMPGSPAAVAGVQVGDELVSRDGVDALAAPPPPRRRFATGDTIWLGVRRAGQSRELTLVMGRMVHDSVSARRVCRPTGPVAAARP